MVLEFMIFYSAYGVGVYGYGSLLDFVMQFFFATLCVLFLNPFNSKYRSHNVAKKIALQNPPPTYRGKFYHANHVKNQRQHL